MSPEQKQMLDDLVKQAGGPYVQEEIICPPEGLLDFETFIKVEEVNIRMVNRVLIPRIKQLKQERLDLYKSGNQEEYEKFVKAFGKKIQTLKNDLLDEVMRTFKLHPMLFMDSGNYLSQ